MEETPCDVTAINAKNGCPEHASEREVLASTDPPPPAGSVSRTEMPTAGEEGEDNENSDEEEGEDNDETKLPFSKNRCIVLVATLTGATFMNTMSNQAVVIILPSIGKQLSIPDSRQQWVVSAYALTFGCFLLLWGRISDVYGKRKIFLLGSAWFAATTMVNPFLPNEVVFFLFRGLQGIGAAANMPSAIGILGVTFPPGKAKNYAFSTYAAGAPLGSVFGSILGGLIASYASWRWVFFAIAILSALITIAGFFIIPPPATTLHGQGVTARASIDWIGAFLITAALLALLFALTEGNSVGWSTPWVPVVIVLSLLLVITFVLWQRSLESGGRHPPLIKVSVFHSLRFSAALLVMALFFACFSGFLIFATYYFQDLQGLSPIQNTLRFIPEGIAGIACVAIVSQLLSRVPTYWILIAGTACGAVACMLFATPISPHTSYFAYGLPAMILSVLGADSTSPSLTLFTSHSLPREDQALGGALINSVAQIGRALGLAIATAAQTAVMAHARHTSVDKVGPTVPWDGPTWEGLRAAQWLNAGFGLAALVVTAAVFRGLGIIGKVPARRTRSGTVVRSRGMGVDEEMQEQGARVTT